MSVGLIEGAGLLLRLLPYTEKLLKWNRLRKAKDLFGSDIANEYFLIWPQYVPPQAGLNKPYPRLAQHVYYGAGTQPEVAASAEVRAVAYLSKEIGDLTGSVPSIVPDVEVETEMDLSFISLGALTNYKTQDCLRDGANVFVDMTADSIVSKRAHQPPISRSRPDEDYGLILKIPPETYPQRNWICCAGIADWGTSGAAYYLANHWRELWDRAKSRPFACVTRTEVRSDESTSMFAFLGQ